MGLLLAFDHLDPFQALIYAIPFNFYAILTLILVFYLAFSGKSYGPMKSFEENPVIEEIADEEQQDPESWTYMIIPLLIMVFTMPMYLIYSGWDPTMDGSFGTKLWSSIGNGSGGFSVTAAVATALLFTGLYLGLAKKINVKSFFEESLKGMNDMLIMAILMVLAFALGNLCNEHMGTGQYVADVTSQWLSPALAPMILFLTSCFVAFATGTSWGTFAIMIAIGVPVAQSVGLNPYLAIAAVLGGGVFGDHCSPISDTTLISSVAARCDHIDHVRTQLPYALFTGGISTILYLIAGIILS